MHVYLTYLISINWLTCMMPLVQGGAAYPCQPRALPFLQGLLINFMLLLDTASHFLKTATVLAFPNWHLKCGSNSVVIVCDPTFETLPEAARIGCMMHASFTACHASAIVVAMKTERSQKLMFYLGFFSIKYDKFIFIAMLFFNLPSLKTLTNQERFH